VPVLEQQSGMLEGALLARGVDVDQHVGGGQDGCETIHEACARPRSGAGQSDKAMNYETRALAALRFVAFVVTQQRKLLRRGNTARPAAVS